MDPLWIIIRSITVQPEDDEERTDPVVCGVYKHKKEAVGEMLKLFIEDGILSETESTKEFLLEIKKDLISGDLDSIFTNYGNTYTLSMGIVGAKHSYEADVIKVYDTLRKPRSDHPSRDKKRDKSKDKNKSRDRKK